MNIKKRLSYPSSSKLSFTVPNFLAGISTEYDSGMLSPRLSVTSYNFDFSGGTLKNGLGFKEGLLELFVSEKRDAIKQELDLLPSIIRVYAYRNYSEQENKRGDKLLILSSDMVLYILDLSGNNTSLNRVRNISFTSVPKAISYRLDGEDVLILASPTDNMVIYDGKNLPYEVLDAPVITSMDIHFERLFATTDGERSRIVFSDDLDPTNWSIDLSTAGFIELVDERGALNRVISFNDYLYIFRDYGISRLTAYGDQEGFSISHLFVSSSKIYPETVTVCGDQILFLSSTGLYSFDGYNTNRILPELFNLIAPNNENSFGAYYMSKYYLSLNMKFDERSEFDDKDFNCNALLEIDTKTKKYKITRGVDIKCILPVLVGGVEKLYLCARNNSDQKYQIVCLDNSGTFLGNPLFKVWQTDFYGFGKHNNRKCLRSISLDSNAGNVITIKSNNGRSRTIQTLDGARTYNLMLFGSKFSFCFSSDSETSSIISPELTILIGGGE